MKKAAKIFLIIAGILMILGVVLCVGAFASVGFDLAKFNGIHGELSEYTADIEGQHVTELVLENISGQDMAYCISLVPSDDDDFHITYASYNIDDIQWALDDGVLRFYSPKDQWQDRILTVSFGLDSAPLTIEVPASVRSFRCDLDAAELTCEGLALTGDFFCNSDAAAVELLDMEVNGQLSVDGDAADIRMTHINTGSLNVNCDFGNVELEDIIVGDVVIDSDTCDMDLTSVFSDGYLDIAANFGSIVMNSVSADAVNVEADTCDVDFASLSVENALTFDVAFGDINGTLDEAQSSFTVFTKVDFGDCSLFPGGNGPKNLDIAVDTGDVDIRFLK